MARRFDITAPIRYSTSDPEGDKTLWQRVGIATEQKDGSIRLRIVALPLPSLNWDGTLVLFERQDEE